MRRTKRKTPDSISDPIRGKHAENIILDAKPDLILCSDMHLREDIPTCWIGDFQMEEWGSVVFVNQLQEHYKCPVVHAGDLFHHWKPSPWLLSMAIKYLPQNFYTVYGQHDLPQHNLELRVKSGINTLMEAGKVKVLETCHYGQIPDKRPNTWALLPMIGSKPTSILVWHHMTYQKPPFPGATDGNAKELLKKYPQFNLIVTGDNHQSFSEEYKGRLLVNPGSLTRQKADQIDFQPRVALWFADTNTIQWINIPIQKDAISREHIKTKEQRDQRIDAYVSKMNSDWKASMSFEQNLEAHKNKNKTKQPIMDIIYKSMEKK